MTELLNLQAFMNNLTRTKGNLNLKIAGEVSDNAGEVLGFVEWSAKARGYVFKARPKYETYEAPDNPVTE